MDWGAVLSGIGGAADGAARGFSWEQGRRDTRANEEAEREAIRLRDERLAELQRMLETLRQDGDEKRDAAATQACENASSAGDICSVASGTYNEAITVDVSGSAGNRITFIWNGASTRIILAIAIVLAWASPAQAQPTFVNCSAGADGTGDVNVGAPSSPVSGDIWVLVFHSEGEDVNPEALPTGGEWTSIGTAASGTTGNIEMARVTVAWFRYAGSTPNTTVPDTGNATHGLICAFRGALASGDPMCGTAVGTDGQATNDTTVTATGMTTTASNCLVIIASVAGEGDGVTTWPGAGQFSGWTNGNLSSIGEAFDGFGISGADGAVAMAYGGKAGAGATGDTTATLAVSVDDASVVFALQPAASASSGCTSTLLGVGCEP